MGSVSRRSFSNYISKLGIVCWLFLSVHLAHAATIEVTTTNDGGPGSLRQAIVDSLETPEQDEIRFNVPVSDALYDPVTAQWTFLIFSPLPTLTEDGLRFIGESHDGIPRYVVTGANSALDARVHGLVIEASQVVVENIAFVGFTSFGVVIQDATRPISDVALYGVVAERNGFSPDFSGCEKTSPLGGVRIHGAVKDVVLGSVRVQHNNCFGVKVTNGSSSPTNILIQSPTVISNRGVGVLTEGVNVTVQGVAAQSASFLDNVGSAIVVHGTQGFVLRDVDIQHGISADPVIEITNTVNAFVARVRAVAVQSPGFFITLSKDVILRDVEIKDALAYGIHFVGSAFSANEVSFLDINGDGIRLEPSYGTTTLVSRATLHRAAFNNVQNAAIRNQESCVVATETDVASDETVFEKRFLVTFDTQVSEESEIFIDGSGYRFTKLYPVTENIYGLSDTRLHDVTTWPLARSVGAARSSAKIIADIDGVQYTGTIDVDYEARCGVGIEDISSTYDNYEVVFLSTTTESTRTEKTEIPALYTHEPTESEETTVSKRLFIMPIAIVFVVSLVLFYKFLSFIGVYYEKTDKNMVVLTAEAKDKTARRKRKPLLDRSFFFACAQFLVNGLNYIFLLIMARVMLPEELAVVNAVLAVFFILSIPTFLIQDFITNQFSGRYKKAEIRVVLYVYSKLICTCLAVTVLLALLFQNVLRQVLEIPDLFSYVLLLVIICLNYTLPLPRGLWQARRKFVRFGAHLLLETAVKLGVFFILLLFAVPPLAAVLAAVGAGYVVSAIWLYACIYSERLLAVRHDAAVIKRAKKWIAHSFSSSGIYFLCTVGTFSLLYNIDLIYVKYAFPEIAPEYGVAARIAQLAVFGGISIATANLPLFYTFPEQKAWEALRQPLTLISIGIACFFMIILIGRDTFIATFFGEEYRSAYPILLRISLGSTAIAFSIVGAYLLLSRKLYTFVTQIGYVLGFFIVSLMAGVYTTPTAFMGSLVISNVLILSIIYINILSYSKQISEVHISTSEDNRKRII